jgi:hypothetical protein
MASGVLRIANVREVSPTNVNLNVSVPVADLRIVDAAEIHARIGAHSC